VYKVVVLGILSILLSSCAARTDVTMDKNAKTGFTDIHGGKLKSTDIAEEPKFPGGNDEFLDFLSANIKYPYEAKSSYVEGKVIVGFVVTSKGEIQDVQIFKGIGYGLDEEAMRVVKLMPNWIPGRLNGQPASVRIFVPIVFALK